MEELIASVYYSYGGQVGYELEERFVIEDTKEVRKGLIDEFVPSDGDCYDEQEFLKGDRDDCYASLYGEWDDPTGVTFVIQSVEELIKEIKAIAEHEIKCVDSLINNKGV